MILEEPPSAHVVPLNAATDIDAQADVLSTI